MAEGMAAEAGSSKLFNQRLLIESAKSHDIASMERALAGGAEIDGKCEEGMTALMWALSMGDLGCYVPEEKLARQTKAIVWLAARSDVNARNLKGSTALGIAALRLDADGMRALLRDPRVDVDMEGAHGRTPLRLVAGRSFECEAMLGARVDVSSRDSKGVSPLELAQARGCCSLAELLLARLERLEIDSAAGLPLGSRVGQRI